MRSDVRSRGVALALIAVATSCGNGEREANESSGVGGSASGSGGSASAAGAFASGGTDLTLSFGGTFGSHDCSLGGASEEPLGSAGAPVDHHHLDQTCVEGECSRGLTPTWRIDALTQGKYCQCVLRCSSDAHCPGVSQCYPFWDVPVCGCELPLP